MFNFFKKKEEEAKKKLSEFFRPSEKVRARDIVRELPKGTKKTAQNLAQDIVRFGISAVEAPKSYKTGKASGKFYNTPVGRVNSFQSEAQNRVKRGDSLIKAIGNPALDTILAGSDLSSLKPLLSNVKNVKFLPKEARLVASDLSQPLTQKVKRRASKLVTKEPVPGVWVDGKPQMRVLNKPQPKYFTFQETIPSPFKSKLMQSLQRPGLTAKAVGNGKSIENIVKKPTKFSQKIPVTNKPLYEVSKNNDVLKKAKGNLSMGQDFALKQARNDKLGAEANATAMELMDDAISKGAWDRVDMYAKEFAPRFSKQGQEIQILSRWGRLTPSGAINYTQHLLDKVMQENKVKVEFTKEAKQEISDLAKKVQKTEDGTRDRDIASALLMKRISQELPSSLGRKISTAQTMAQLLNPKTAIRNIVGNAGFAAGEVISDVVGTPIDKLLSLRTGKRTKTIPSLQTLLSGAKKGAKEGFQEAALGIDTKNLPSQFDLANGPTFKSKFGQNLEKALGFELKAMDRSFYQSAYDESMRQQMKLGKVSNATTEMEEIAHQDALYKTFQDDSKASILFSGIKKALNMNQDFGLGDIVLKYPKTPGNLLARAIDYSPAGYAKAILELAQPAFRKEFNQKKFVEAISRGTVGSVGLVGLGAMLGKAGIITADAAEDGDIRNLERAQGQGQFKVNISALRRLMFFGLTGSPQPKEGDRLMSYDWLQPFAVPISMGVNAVSENKRSKSSIVADSISSGANTLAEQPLVQGMQRLFGYGDVVGGLQETAKGVPSSFVPTLSSQVRQITDNQRRQLQGGGVYEEMKALVKNKVPGLSRTLPQRYNTLGEKDEMYQNNSNNLFNVFLNPAFMSRIETTPGGKEVMDIYNNSGETQQAPRTAPKKIKISGVDMELTPELISEYQKYIGERTSVAFDILSQDSEFQKNTDEDKAKVMADILTDINTTAKRELLGDASGGFNMNEPYADIASIPEQVNLSTGKSIEKNISKRNLGDDFSASKINDRQTQLFNEKMNKLKNLPEWGSASADDRQKITKALSTKMKHEATAQMIAINAKGMEKDELKKYLSDLNKSGILTKTVLEVYLNNYAQ